MTRTTNASKTRSRLFRASAHCIFARNKNVKVFERSLLPIRLYVAAEFEPAAGIGGVIELRVLPRSTVMIRRRANRASAAALA